MRVLVAYVIAAISITTALLLTLLIPPIRQQLWLLLFVFCCVGIVITWITRRLHHSREATHAAAAMIESSADSIIRTSLDNRILSWNKAAEHTYGFSAEEAIGRPVSLIVPPDYMEELHRLTEQVHQGGSIQNLETVRTRKDGARINVALTLSPVQDRDGRIVAMSTIARDIRDRKRAEEAIRESHEKLEQHTHQLRLLAEMGHLLQASSAPADAYSVAAHFAQKLIPATSGAVFACSAPTKDLEVVSRWGELQPDEQDLLSPDDCWALRTGHAHFVNESHTSLLCRHLPDPPPACYLCVPMIAHSETFGMLHFRLSPPRQASSGEASPESVEFPWPATSIADQLALAVANMKLREALRSQSIRDSLTGWFNRRYMEETLEREILRASRSRRPLSIIMLDVDHFKEFNDSFGHEAGDMVLQKLCQTLKSHVRNEDVACRYGGDEFVLVLPDTSAELAASRAEELRIAVAQMSMQYQAQLPGLLTLSVGVATFPTDGNTLKELLRASDDALFRAKSDGRDRVRLHNRI